MNPILNLAQSDTHGYGSPRYHIQTEKEESSILINNQETINFNDLVQEYTIDKTDNYGYGSPRNTKVIKLENSNPLKKFADYISNLRMTIFIKQYSENKEIAFWRLKKTPLHFPKILKAQIPNSKFN